jgi:hypothetical protein
MSNASDIEFGGIITTFELCDCILDTIDNDVEFFEQSVIDILEG